MLSPARAQTRSADAADALSKLAAASDAPQDFYQLLDIDYGASKEEVKAGYRRLQKKCHPVRRPLAPCPARARRQRATGPAAEACGGNSEDRVGLVMIGATARVPTFLIVLTCVRGPFTIHPHALFCSFSLRLQDVVGVEAIECCILMNEAYGVLSDVNTRRAYDEEIAALKKHVAQGYTGEPLSEWGGDDPARSVHEQRGVFVDEVACIGCQHCVHAAPGTFGLEEEWGRARVHTQWGDSEDDITDAISCCPVDCIHFVEKENLAVLEWAMTQSNRVDVGVMLGGGPKGDDPFDVAAAFIRRGDERRARLQAKGLEGASAAGDSHVAFLKDVSAAWNKLSAQTKAAWTRLGAL